METSQAQKNASEAYRQRQQAQGQRQHLIWASDEQWEVIKQVAKALKQIDFKLLKSIDVDDNGKYINFIYNNRAESRVVLTNQGQDDEG